MQMNNQACTLPCLWIHHHLSVGENAMQISISAINAATFFLLLVYGLAVIGTPSDPVFPRIQNYRVV